MQVFLYGKPGCQLCEAARMKLKLLKVEHTVRDIESTLAYHDGWQEDGTYELMAQHAMIDQRVPMLIIDGRAFDYASAMKEIRGRQEMNKCAVCLGCGRIHGGDTPSQKCWRCNGSGKVPYYRDREPEKSACCHNPRSTPLKPTGQYPCPECKTPVIAGQPHPRDPLEHVPVYLRLEVKREMAEGRRVEKKPEATFPHKGPELTVEECIEGIRMVCEGLVEKLVFEEKTTSTYTFAADKPRVVGAEAQARSLYVALRRVEPQPLKFMNFVVHRTTYRAFVTGVELEFLMARQKDLI